MIALHRAAVEARRHERQLLPLAPVLPLLPELPLLPAAGGGPEQITVQL
jgi:hypothetical protein